MDDMTDSHDYQRDLYFQLHDSEMQRHFRKVAPMPYGVVMLPWDGMTEEELRNEYRTMKKLGFTNLKQIMESPEWDKERLLTIAMEEGIIPFWYGEGGWEHITDELLTKLNIPLDTPIEDIRQHPAMVDYQNEVLRKRIPYDKFRGSSGVASIVFGFQGDLSTIQITPDPELSEELVAPFKAWCQETYGEIEALNDAWNAGEVGIARQQQKFTSWDDFDPMHFNDREYRRIRDILRFKADWVLTRIGNTMQRYKERDPYEPQRAGGEMGIFLPFAYRATDMEGYAELMREHGSFYPSLHLAWHYEEVGYEVTRCIYMQSSLCSDWFKGGGRPPGNRPVAHSSSLAVRGGIQRRPKRPPGSHAMQALRPSYSYHI